MAIKFIKRPEVLKKNARSRTAHYDDVKQGLCTKPVLIGLRSVAWPEHEIDEINAARLAGMDDDQIRDLVSKLEAERRTYANKVGEE